MKNFLTLETMKSDDVRAIKHLTKNLPPEVELIPYVYTWAGADLMLAGYKDLDPRGLYQVSSYVIRHVNHEARVKRAFKSGGVEAVRRYTREAMDKYLAK